MNRKLQPIPFTIVILVAILFTILSYVYLFCWLIGAVAYIRRPEKVSYQYIIVSIIISLYALIGIELGIGSAVVPVELYSNIVPSLAISKILLATGIALFIQQVIMIKPKYSLFLRLDSAGTKLAAFSYTLYLTHYPLLLAISHFGTGQATRIDLTSIMISFFKVIICLVFGWVFYLFFEKHTAELRRIIRTWIAGLRKKVAIDVEIGASQ